MNATFFQLIPDLSEAGFRLISGKLPTFKGAGDLGINEAAKKTAEGDSGNLSWQ